LDQALQRQLGAYDIDIDTEAGWTRFALYGEAELDFMAVGKTLCDANYELRTIEVETTGEVVHGDGGATLVVSATGQRIPLHGEPAPSSAGPIRGTVIGWDAAEAKLELQ